MAEGCRDTRPQSKARQGWGVSTGSEGEQADWDEEEADAAGAESKWVSRLGGELGRAGGCHGDFGSSQ